MWLSTLLLMLYFCILKWKYFLLCLVCEKQFQSRILLATLLPKYSSMSDWLSEAYCLFSTTGNLNTCKHILKMFFCDYSVLQTCLHVCFVCVWRALCTVRRSVQTWPLFQLCLKKQPTCTHASTRSTRSATKTSLILVGLEKESVS